ncbi:hypothetical protein Hanom_Chr12g01138581 [Helianthus anomalus]
MDDFQPFAVIDHVVDDAPLGDDVLVIPQPPHDMIIYGYPDGEHQIVHFAIPLAFVPPIINLDDDDDFVLVFHVDHLEDYLGDKWVFEVVILEIPSPAIFVVDVSSSTSTATPTTPSPVMSPTSVVPTHADSKHTNTIVVDHLHFAGFSYPSDPPSHFEFGEPSD